MIDDEAQCARLLFLVYQLGALATYIAKRAWLGLATYILAAQGEGGQQIWLYLGSPAAWKSWDTLSCSQTTTGGSTASQLIKKTR